MASLGEQELAGLGVEFTAHEYDYRIKGAGAAAAALGIPVAATVKTLVVELRDRGPAILLAGGDIVVSMRSLARCLGVKGAQLASEKEAERLTGYRVGGIGPFGLRTPLPVLADLGILEHDRVYVNGGRRGLLLGLDPEALVEATRGVLLEVARP